MDGVKLVRTRVWHRRTAVVENAFSYSALYCLYKLGLSGQRRGNWLFGYNRRALLCLLDRDLGGRVRGENLQWVQRQLAVAGLDADCASVQVLSMPRFLGFVFNPVSFWFCSDSRNQLRAVIAEVHNTFRDRHSYICAHEDGRPIQPADALFAQKDFHVSPFFERDGQYRFRFHLGENRLKVDIDYLDKAGQLRLGTGLQGDLMEFDYGQLARELVRAPLVSLASCVQIGWQALILRLKKVSWHDRPTPKQPVYSRTLDAPASSSGEL